MLTAADYQPPRWLRNPHLQSALSSSTLRRRRGLRAFNATGAMTTEHILDEAGITANKNTVPGETRSPFVTSGVRLGTPAVTTRGMGPAEMKIIADCIADCIWHYDEKRDDISARVLGLTKAFPLYE